jgi:hypothetical protein
MKTFAVLENSIVINIILANSLEIAESVTSRSCVEIIDKFVDLGMKYKDNEFSYVEGDPRIPKDAVQGTQGTQGV